MKIFHEVAYRARDRQDLLAGKIDDEDTLMKSKVHISIYVGIDDFLDHVTVLPPGEWDPTTRIEPPKTVPKKVG